MFNPSTMTLGELSAALRDFAIFSGIAIAAWKARSLVQPLIDLYKRVATHLDKAEKHMQVMETSMNVLLTNHLTHIEEYAKSLSENAQRGS